MRRSSKRRRPLQIHIDVRTRRELIARFARRFGTLPPFLCLNHDHFHPCVGFRIVVARSANERSNVRSRSDRRRCYTNVETADERLAACVARLLPMDLVWVTRSCCVQTKTATTQERVVAVCSFLALELESSVKLSGAVTRKRIRLSHQGSCSSLCHIPPSDCSMVRHRLLLLCNTEPSI